MAGAAITGCSPSSGTPATREAANPLSLPFFDAKLPTDQRVADLVGRLTLEEKVAQMQMDAPAIPRLGIPAYHWWNEALHGIARNGEATVFPQAIGLAATWDPALHHQMAKVIAVETRAKHNAAFQQGITAIYTGLDLWSPNINIFRDPRWGRGQETYGEDPFLTSRFAVAFVTGIQGDDSKYFTAIATPKHFAVHSGPEPERHRFDPEPSDQDLFTTYLPAFEAAVREGHAYSVMAAYNSLDGLPCSANPRLLTDILRNQWGFQGYVVSDVDAVQDVWENHQTVASPEEAAAISVKAGCDLNGGTTYSALTTAVQMGLLKESDIDRSVTRLFTARFKLGLFDPPAQVPLATLPPSANDTRAHDALALKEAEESLVLLKNDAGTLPMDKTKLQTLAVIGPTADSLTALVGNYNGTPARPVTILQGLRNALEADGGAARVLYAPGCPLVEEQLPLEEPVPSSALYTDGTERTHGLLGDYYPTSASTRPIRTRIDPQIDFDWSIQGDRDPLPLANQEGAGAMPGAGSTYIHWTGDLVPPETGTYTLGLSARDAFRLYLDGEPLVDEWTLGGRRSHGARVHLEKGKVYHLTVDYLHPPASAQDVSAATRPTATEPAAATQPFNPNPPPPVATRSGRRGGGGRGFAGRGFGAARGPRAQPLDAAIQLRWTRPSNDEVANGPEPYYADAVRLASRADATVLVLGLTADLEREEHDIDYRGFFGGDRTAIELPPVQAELLKRVTAAAQQNHKPVVLVLTAGSALAIPWANDHVPAILDAWYPGQDGGTAVANALFGVTNPAGRLPVTFYAATTDLPDFEDYSMAPSDHSPGRTYRYFTRKPLYPFGYGLSYTHFSYAAAGAPKSSATDADLQVSFSVTNAGDRPGDEVAQLYLSRPGTPAGLRESLVGFQRLTLAPKESRTITFTITPYQLATIDAAGRRLVPTGDITLRCGGSSDATAGVSTTVSLTGQVATPTYKIVPPTLAQQQ
ncbi:MAG TPA: glycoside hydrolase family 3 N-terminal domain-containing protein [Phycisphaerae bacterium]|nr:glycoside hydrolase family 3 N-terminal domain-containing protein [Phycisphaerae bacterium]